MIIISVLHGGQKRQLQANKKKITNRLQEFMSSRKNEAFYMISQSAKDKRREDIRASATGDWGNGTEINLKSTNGTVYPLMILMRCTQYSRYAGYVVRCWLPTEEDLEGTGMFSKPLAMNNAAMHRNVPGKSRVWPSTDRFNIQYYRRVGISKCVPKACYSPLAAISRLC